MKEESLKVRENEIKAICIFVSCIKNIKYIKENNKNKLFINKIIILHFFYKKFILYDFSGIHNSRSSVYDILCREKKIYNN